MPAIEITAAAETWPLRETFTISRGSKSAAHVVVVTARCGDHVGRGEAVPYARYGETIENTLADIGRLVGTVTTRAELAIRMKPGAARNAIDCALWDLEAKIAGRTVAELADLPRPQPTLTAYTISLDAPDAMAAKAREASNLPLLKLKLGRNGASDCMRAVRAARPDARLIVDANEAWTAADYVELSRIARDYAIEVIEQPFPATMDAALADIPRLVPICADESVHTAADVPRLATLYDAVNIKLDKAGGLTGAIALADAAASTGLDIMLGSMVSTSLAAAPALLLAARARWVDLDGPLLLAGDRDGGLVIRDGIIEPNTTTLWG